MIADPRGVSSRDLIKDIATWDRDTLEMFAAYVARYDPETYAIAVTDTADLQAAIAQRLEHNEPRPVAPADRPGVIRNRAFSPPID